VTYDVVVIGSGPNGLAAAITIARTGRSVLVREAAATIGGGTRSEELTLPGFVHDVCSAIHPLAAVSPFFRALPLREHGLHFADPPAALAHPLDDGTAVMLERSVDSTAAGLVEDDEPYRRVLGRLAADWPRLDAALLGPVVRAPRHPVALARFAFHALRSASAATSSLFRGERARALFAGCSGHSMLPPDKSVTAAFGLVLLTLGHVAGWPVARGGSQAIADALASYLRSLGGEIETGRPVESLGDLPRARAVLCDVTPRQLVRIAGDRLPPSYRHALERYRYGPGAFKLDYALDGPIPWRAPECARAACVHLGGTMEEIAASAGAVWEGREPEHPFLLVGQQSLFDVTRAPPDKHTAWAYCHVPNGSTTDMTERVEAQLERFAPGFRDRILARSALFPADLERHNPNIVGGDINGGVQDLPQIVGRPVYRLVPYSTPLPGLFVCSASTPPGGGVHGMCGHLAARAALRTALRDRSRPDGSGPTRRTGAVRAPRP
jgi:phytoene dehydrogenase-like protein